MPYDFAIIGGGAATDADIVVTTTPSREPVIKKQSIRPGTHINAIGADAKGKQELITDNSFF